MSTSTVWEKLREADCEMGRPGPNPYQIPPEVWEKLRNKEITVTQAAVLCGVEIHTIERAVAQENRNRPTKRRKDACSYTLPPEMIDAYKRRELNIVQIAEKMGKSFGETRLSLKLAGVKIYNASQTQTRFKQDEAIFQDYQVGATLPELAVYYKKTPSWLWRVVERTSKRLGIKKRARSVRRKQNKK
jgi:Mor family transcriptional regulator